MYCQTQFVCTGNVRYNTHLVRRLAERTIEEIISRTGEIHVLPTLQLAAYPHIFAIGDCADASPIKLATAAFDQARCCARNIFRLIRHRRAWENERALRATTSALHSLTLNPSGPSGEQAEENPDETAKLARYRMVPKFVLSLGPNDGVGQWPYIGILPSWFACRHKSRRLMLAQIYRFFGSELPPRVKTV
jgi:NADH dehydrogenase FAD-containing subunit